MKRDKDNLENHVFHGFVAEQIYLHNVPFKNRVCLSELIRVSMWIIITFFEMKPS